MCVFLAPLAAGLAAGVGASAAGATALTAASLGLSALGGVTAAIGQYQQGQAARKQAAYQAAVARNNALISERQAQDALDRGKVDEQNQRDKTSLLIGRARNQLAGSGFDLQDDTSLSLLSDTRAAGELDALTIRTNAARDAYGYRVRGMNFDAQAGLDEASGAAAAQAGTFGAVSTLLTTAGTVASRWNAKR